MLSACQEPTTPSAPGTAMAHEAPQPSRNMSDIFAPSPRRHPPVRQIPHLNSRSLRKSWLFKHAELCASCALHIIMGS